MTETISIALQKKFRVPLRGQSTERVTVACHHGHDLVWRLGKVQQRFIHLCLQQGKVGEVLQMCRHLLDFLPQIFDGIAIRRIGGQLHLGQARDMGGKKLLHGFTGMVACPILNDKDMLRGF